MRYHKPFPRSGQRRQKVRFLWLPKNIRGEVRWWEVAIWEEIAVVGGNGYFWEPTRWIDDPYEEDNSALDS